MDLASLNSIISTASTLRPTSLSDPPPKLPAKHPPSKPKMSKDLKHKAETNNANSPYWPPVTDLTSKVSSHEEASNPANGFYWPPYNPANSFSSVATPASRIRNLLPRAAVAKYYPNGFPPDWEDPPAEEAAPVAVTAKYYPNSFTFRWGDPPVEETAAADPVAAAARAKPEPPPAKKAILSPWKAKKTEAERHLPTIPEEQPPSPRLKMTHRILTSAARPSASPPAPPLLPARRSWLL